jgi:hypothetical protein
MRSSADTGWCGVVGESSDGAEWEGGGARVVASAHALMSRNSRLAWARNNDGSSSSSAWAKWAAPRLGCRQSLT